MRKGEDDSSGENDDGSTDSVYAVENSYDDRDLKCKMNIAGEDVIFQVDTGATCNLLPERLARNIKPYWGTLTMWNDSNTSQKAYAEQQSQTPKMARSTRPDS